MSECVLLDAGSGGRASQRLIGDVFLRHFRNEILQRMDDAAELRVESAAMAMSTDGYTVSPLFFPGGSIGTLAINGTVNDVAMLGARPRFLSCAFVIEEGLPLTTLEAVVADMARCCTEAGVKIVTGDTKVVPRGACDKLFITTTGVGGIMCGETPSGARLAPGDVILVSGSMGDHGLAIMAARNELSFLSDVRSDCAPLADMVANLLAAAPVHALRDPTRGGLATTLQELAEQSHVCVEIEEDSIPVHSSVAEGCSILGLDPLYLANEGKCICVVPDGCADAALGAMRASPYGEEAAVIGRVTDKKPGSVILKTRMGGARYLNMLEGAPLPRIC